jgi:hypothetical protein
LIEIQPPHKFIHVQKPKIFLGGAIEMGMAEDWQKRVISELTDHDIAILNPRRTDWDPTWKQVISNPQFNGQVEWELNGLDDSDIILFVFASNINEAKKIKAPITLLELGLHIREKTCFVCCPEGYWRKGNVDIVCARNKTKVYEDLDDMLFDLKAYIDNRFWYTNPKL